MYSANKICLAFENFISKWMDSLANSKDLLKKSQMCKVTVFK